MFNYTLNLNKKYLFEENKKTFGNLIDNKKRKKHPFHIVTNSPWPLFVGISVLGLTISFVAYMHSFYGSLFIFFWSFIFLLISLSNWWFDVTMEATYEGEHTLKVQKMYNTAFLLFLISELFFFITLFWAFFHYGQQPNINVGVSWLPLQIRALTVSHIALPAMLNVLLIMSSVTLFIAHYFVSIFNKKYTIFFLGITILLGFSFTVFQYIEYLHTPINFSQTSFGSLLYLLTGFHGSHVIIGTVFLTICLIRFSKGHFSAEHRIGFEYAILYWHFVDFIWVFVLMLIYISNVYFAHQQIPLKIAMLNSIFFEVDEYNNIWFHHSLFGPAFAMLFESIFTSALTNRNSTDVAGEHSDSVLMYLSFDYADVPDIGNGYFIFTFKELSNFFAAFEEVEYAINSGVDWDTYLLVKEFVEIQIEDEMDWDTYLAGKALAEELLSENLDIDTYYDLKDWVNEHIEADGLSIEMYAAFVEFLSEHYADAIDEDTFYVLMEYLNAYYYNVDENILYELMFLLDEHIIETLDDDILYGLMEYLNAQYNNVDIDEDADILYELMFLLDEHIIETLDDDTLYGLMEYLNVYYNNVNINSDADIVDELMEFITEQFELLDDDTFTTLIDCVEEQVN